MFPLLKLSMNCLYPKIAGKDCPLTKIWVNNAMHEDFNWATHHMHASFGINLLLSVSWDAEVADVTVFCDTCMEGLTFYYPDCLTGFYAPIPNNTACDIIFYFVALAVASACNDLKKMMTDQLHEGMACSPHIGRLQMLMWDTYDQEACPGHQQSQPCVLLPL